MEMEKCQLCQSIVLDALTNSVDKTLSSQGKDGWWWVVGWLGGMRGQSVGGMRGQSVTQP